MTIPEMKMAISRVYPGQSWKTKVENMPEGQVVAVYLSFEKNGTFRKDLTKHNKPYVDKSEKNGRKVQQLTIDDFLKRG